MSKFIVGVDSGINSTGITIYDVENRFYHMLCYPVKGKYKWADSDLRKKLKMKKEDISLDGINYNLRVKVQPNQDSGFITWVKNAEYLINMVKEIITPHDKVELYFEEVIFGAGKSNSISTYGGILKYLFYHNFGCIYEGVHNGTIKKAVTGSGRASKTKMIRYIKRYSAMEDIFNKLDDLNIYKYDGGFCEDITDSFALVQTVLKGDSNG